MGNIALITDSACDLSCETLEKYNIKVIPLRINFSNKTFRDRVDITPLELYDMLKNEIPKTSLPSAEDVNSVFDKVKDAEKIFYIGLSSGLSGTYNFIKLLGKEAFGERFFSFDTKTLSGGQGLLIEKAAQMIEEGKSISDILVTLNIIRSKMFAEFIVKDITYLAQGGRIGKVAGTLGSLLKICPIIKVNDEGVYETAGKSMGFSRSLQVMLNQLQNKLSGLKIIVEIVHGLEETAAKNVLSKIKQFSDVIQASIIPVTAVLGVHTGPGLIGIIAYEP